MVVHISMFQSQSPRLGKPQREGGRSSDLGAERSFYATTVSHLFIPAMWLVNMDVLDIICLCFLSLLALEVQTWEQRKGFVLLN